MATNETLPKDSLKNHPLFDSIKAEHYNLILEKIESLKFNSNEYIFKEGDTADKIFIISQGQAEVFKLDLGKKGQFKIASLKPGDIFGEMWLIDQQPRSATVKTVTEVIAFELSEKSIKELDQKIFGFSAQINTNISKINNSRLRGSNEKLVQSLKNEIELLNEKNQFGSFFIIMVIVFGIGNFYTSTIKELGLDPKNPIINSTFILTLLIPTLILQKKFNYSFSNSGISLIHWKKSLTDGIFISLALIGIFFVVTQTITSLNLHSLKTSIVISYIFSSIVQEFITRGIFQTVLQKFYADQKGIKSVMITSMIFGMFHLYAGIFAAITIFFASVLFGLIYIRSYNLIGVSLVHFTIGILGLILGLI